MVRNLMLPQSEGGGGLTEKQAESIAANAIEKLRSDEDASDEIEST